MISHCGLRFAQKRIQWCLSLLLSLSLSIYLCIVCKKLVRQWRPRFCEKQTTWALYTPWRFLLNRDTSGCVNIYKSKNGRWTSQTEVPIMCWCLECKRSTCLWPKAHLAIPLFSNHEDCCSSRVSYHLVLRCKHMFTGSNCQVSIPYKLIFISHNDNSTAVIMTPHELPMTKNKNVPVTLLNFHREITSEHTKDAFPPTILECHPEKNTSLIGIRNARSPAAVAETRQSTGLKRGFCPSETGGLMCKAGQHLPATLFVTTLQEMPMCTWLSRQEQV